MTGLALLSAVLVAEHRGLSGAGSRTSRVLRAPTLFPSIRFVKMPRTPAAARALSRSADTESAETDCSTMSVFPSNKSQDSANSRQWLEVAIRVGEELGKQIADVLCEVREASGVVGQPGMHLAELIDQDRHSEDDRVKRSRPVGPKKIPIFAQNFGDGREVLGRLVHDFVGRITRDALLVGAVFHVVPQPLKAGAHSAEGMLEE